MSYILDALKKSGKERNRGTVPDVLTVQEPIAYDRKKRNILLSLIAIALLVNAAILIWWLAFSPEKNKVPGNSDAVREIVSGAQETTPGNPAQFPADTNTLRKKEKTMLVGETQPLVTKMNNRSLQETQSMKAVIETVKKGIPQKNDEVDQVHTVKNPQSKDTVFNSPRSQEGIPKPDLKKIYSFKELPEGIRKELPPLSLSIALYSDDPATRVARIDGQSLREGQDLAPGLKLEQIIEHGAILSYRNYRFRIGIQ
ncbi:MAG: general secretion pathway protein GspB [Thermodesulfovibrionales bacterium]|nr:general secretion pathway protein GspB [Thermodesulfovibrionales bacterium]